MVTIFGFLLVMFAGPAWAQLDPVNPEDRKPASKDVKEGWNPGLKLGSNLSFGSSSNVVGQAEGDTKTFGLNVEGKLIYKDDLREWRQTFNGLAATTRTPTIPRFIKTQDEAKYETIYLRGLKNYPRLGPFVKASVQTTLFKGEDVRDKAVTYRIRSPSGATTTVNANSLRLTDAFRPLTTRESAGFFFKAIDSERFKWELRAGLGAIQVQADDQLALRDDNKTPEIEIERLARFDQVGTEVGFTFSAKIDEKTSYALTAEALTPFDPNQKPGDDRNDFEMTNIDVKSNLTSKIYDWANLSYEFRVRKQPELLDEFQVQHLLLLNFAYNVL